MHINLSTRRKWVVSFTSWSLYPEGKVLVPVANLGLENGSWGNAILLNPYNCSTMLRYYNNNDSCGNDNDYEIFVTIIHNNTLFINLSPYSEIYFLQNYLPQ
jgi:hypothetical protein